MTVAENSAVNVNRNERILAYMLASSLGLSVLGILAIIIAPLFGVRDYTGVWNTVFFLPPVGLTLSFLFLVSILVLSARRKARANRDAGK
jgi:hypothetical protein